MARKLSQEEIFDILYNVHSDTSEVSELEDTEDEEEESHMLEETRRSIVSETPVNPEVEVSVTDIAEEIVEISEDAFTHLRWKNGSFTPNIQPFVEIPQQLPHALSTPMEYFKHHVTDDMINKVAQETNIYSVQKTGQCINTNGAEIEKLIGMYLRMGLCQMPSVRCYWEHNLAYPLVSSIMPRNRFEKLLSNLHIKNNLTVTDKEKSDKLWKIRPWLQEFQKRCLTEVPEENHSVDEMMIAFKGRSSLRQYMQSKPTRWGFKLWGRAGASGYMYDFDIYQGAVAHSEKTAKREAGKGVGYDVVIRLTNSLPEGHYFKVFADNFFTTDILVQKLLPRNIYFLGTIRVNRLKDCPLEEEKVLKKQGRGSLSSAVDTTDHFVVVRWYDNKAVTLLSSFVGIEPMDEVRRWDKKKKEHIQVPRPSIVKTYNKFMGGIDLHDMLTSLYKYHFKSRRWYTYIFWHLITVAVINSWLKYRKECKMLGETSMPLRKFQAELAAGLVSAGPGKSKRGRPSAEDMPKHKRRAATTITPVLDCQKDKLEHWPVWKDSRGRCKICIKLNSFVWCEKCEVFLCFNKDRNCFRRFHT